MKHYYWIKETKPLHDIDGIAYVKLCEEDLEEEYVYVYGGDIWSDEDDADRYILQSVVDDSINVVYDQLVDILVRKDRPWNC